MQPIIAIHDLFYTYPDGVEALSNISLTIQPHEIFVLFGPSRSGKSTLLRLLNRLADLTEGGRVQGGILFDGRDIFARAMDVNDLRRRVSMVFALPTPLPGSIRNNLTFGLRMAGIKERTTL
ncbi:MAG: ATP-binding cassette domain-containing protein, partial [Caldilineales bacterium]|nr:ATP-binding cassette domain-containing protein [Caldilineales bacterium]